MESVFQNKYKIASNRLRGWNYARGGHYFITIVTANRENHFGHINNGDMIMNDIGHIVYDDFFKSFEIRQELYLGEFVLMPNHIHAIINLDNTYCTEPIVETHINNVETHINNVETHGRASLQNNVRVSLPYLIRQPKSISSFVAGFKSATINHIDDWIDSNNIKTAKFNRHNPLWQANYYDHIIRSEQEYIQISGYIVNNPLNWDKDRNKNDL